MNQSRASGAILAGIFCGMGAGALWGLVFLAPEIVPGFSPLEQAIGRYLAYGLMSVLLVAPRWRAIRPLLTPRILWALAWLALAGNLFYYVLLVSAVQMGGIAMTSLVVGFLPVAVTIVGSRQAGAVPLRHLAPSLLLCVAGALCIGWQAIVMPEGGAVATRIIGFACAVGALISWTAFAIGNAHWLRRMDGITSQDWNFLIGLATGAQALLFLPLVPWLGSGMHDAAGWIRLATVAFAVALFASIVGNALWNRMTRLLPLTMVGQMILFETGFALLYGFIWEARLPTALEGTAFLLVILSVLSCIAAHRRPIPAKASIAA
ncbi:DMT family transporter [Sphingobium yanoikuyae]|jgi:drug/metabolite transporter (DMT)-like permease|uniref:DMT family transporter n=1 Tax=Sphingobium yanoikuyae TaxID=13690 RepID=UPI000847935E|nr:DMT family transporter [Sphingobium yanoikuyae]MDG2512948.1 DMT family transporter [Sphingobium yanoikuyae]